MKTTFMFFLEVFCVLDLSWNILGKWVRLTCGYVPDVLEGCLLVFGQRLLCCISAELNGPLKTGDASKL